MLEIIRHRGPEVQRLRQDSCSVPAKNVDFWVLMEHAEKLRASVCLMEGLSGRKKEAIISLP
jgi:UDP-N-acetylglucosamine enolpyruvyl transferase